MAESSIIVINTRLKPGVNRGFAYIANRFNSFHRKMAVRFMKRFVNLFLAGTLLLPSCTKKDTTQPPDDEKGVTLQEISDVLPNPFKGFVPWIGTGNPRYETKLQYATFAWKDLEPARGVYDWPGLL